MNPDQRSGTFWLIWGGVLALAVLHQDFWWWDDSETLVAGFIPIGLAYHAGVSVAAAVLWAMAVKFCWPAGLDDDEVRSTAHGPKGEAA